MQRLTSQYAESRLAFGECVNLSRQIIVVGGSFLLDAVFTHIQVDDGGNCQAEHCDCGNKRHRVSGLLHIGDCT